MSIRKHSAPSRAKAFAIAKPMVPAPRDHDNLTTQSGRGAFASFACSSDQYSMSKDLFPNREKPACILSNSTHTRILNRQITQQYGPPWHWPQARSNNTFHPDGFGIGRKNCFGRTCQRSLTVRMWRDIHPRSYRADLMAVRQRTKLICEAPKDAL